MLISLRPVDDLDLDVFFEHLQDVEAVWMAAFTPPDPTDRESFDARWERLRTDDTIVTRTITADGLAVGHIAAFDMAGDREITYWVGREVWGRGVASEAVRQFLDVETTRPLFARTAHDNVGSMRLLEKCGFAHVDDGRGFATARGEEIEELVYRLG
jgi:RimJ/RimL family protein N-acetyltransferase